MRSPFALGLILGKDQIINWLAKRQTMTELISNDTVTKNELSEALFDQVGLNKREAKDSDRQARPDERRNFDRGRT